ncbi:MAG: hypothetical protein V4509_01545 [Patescibacteria group bacterium]
MTTIHQYKEERKKEFDKQFLPKDFIAHNPQEQEMADMSCKLLKFSFHKFNDATIDGVLERVRGIVGDVPQDYLTTYASHTLGKYEERHRILSALEDNGK